METRPRWRQQGGPAAACGIAYRSCSAPRSARSWPVPFLHGDRRVGRGRPRHYRARPGYRPCPQAVRSDDPQAAASPRSGPAHRRDQRLAHRPDHHRAGTGHQTGDCGRRQDIARLTHRRHDRPARPRRLRPGHRRHARGHRRRRQDQRDHPLPAIARPDRLPARHPSPACMCIKPDLHYENVLAADRDHWLAIDPKPLAGDPAFELLPALQNRWHEVLGADDPHRAIRRRFDAMVEVMGLDRQRAVRWTLGRTLQNSLWIVEDGGRALEAPQALIAESLTRSNVAT
ncbi:aminoglycoside phosphotransferase family protein [Actinoplanes sp. NPDC051411]|uniref:aminoglycoside phosphotransferase family protein n=1 Tax=Actinoplanes sp. NPDC051411 TaxID=3155522 RepID=UPI00343CB3A7